MGFPYINHSEKRDPTIDNEESVSIPAADEHSSQDDIAASILPSHAQPIDPALERRVRRKIDLFFIPLMWIGYGFVYYDKVSHSISLSSPLPA